MAGDVCAYGESCLISTADCGADGYWCCIWPGILWAVCIDCNGAWLMEPRWYALSMYSFFMG